jgi:hypothetical protein
LLRLGGQTDLGGLFDKFFRLLLQRVVLAVLLFGADRFSPLTPDNERLPALGIFDGGMRTGKLDGGSAVLLLAQTMFGVSTLVCGRWKTLASSSMFRI